MMQFLAAIEQSGFSVWVRESNSLLAYPGVLFLHTLGMGVVAGISGLLHIRVFCFSTHSEWEWWPESAV